MRRAEPAACPLPRWRTRPIPAQPPPGRTVSSALRPTAPASQACSRRHYPRRSEHSARIPRRRRPPRGHSARQRPARSGSPCSGTPRRSRNPQVQAQRSAAAPRGPISSRREHLPRSRPQSTESDPSNRRSRKSRGHHRRHAEDQSTPKDNARPGSRLIEPPGALHPPQRRVPHSCGLIA